MLAGVAIKPGTKVDVLYELLETQDKAERPDVSPSLVLEEDEMGWGECAVLTRWRGRWCW